MDPIFLAYNKINRINQRGKRNGMKMVKIMKRIIPNGVILVCVLVGLSCCVYVKVKMCCIIWSALKSCLSTIIKMTT